jgi:hypothetical protein
MYVVCVIPLNPIAFFLIFILSYLFFHSPVLNSFVIKSMLCNVVR